jgi:electron transfer flavoprotein alpha subunit
MTENKGILIIVEVESSAPSPVIAELFGAAKSIDAISDEGITAVAVGSGAKSAAGSLGSLSAGKVFVAEVPDLTSATVASIIETVSAEVKPRLILMAETDLGRDLAPLLAARLNTAAVTGVIALRTEGGRPIFTRPVYGGNALADFTIETEPQIVSIRSKTFGPATPDSNRTAEVVQLPSAEIPAGVRVIESIARKEEGPKIEEAKIVIGGGRGLGGPEGFAQLKQLADLLGGVVGASRPPCDQGWWPESGQIGVTGKIIAPDLYIAVGISGSSQHVSGVSGAKTIVAINKDAEANIFKTASYGITADWKKVVPALVAKVKELTGR